MKKLLSGITLGIVLCGLYATAQQPHVTTTLPSATVKLNGASGGGGSGTGFTYDAGEDAWIFTPPSGGSDTRILSDYIGLQDAAGTDIMALSATQGATTYIAARLAAGAIETRDYASLSATGTITGANVQCETGGGAVVGTLDADAATIGRFVYVTRSGANTCTVGVESGHTLDGVTDGTTTVASAGWKTFVQTGATAWVTQASYPSGVSGLTTGVVPYASSATALADTEITRVAQDSYRQVRGTNAQTSEVCGSYTDSSNYGCVRTSFASGNAYLLLQNPGTGGGITTSLTVGTNNTAPLLLRSHGTDRMRLNATGLGFEASDTYAINNVMSMQITRGFQTSKSKALVDATATNIWQVSVANNSYEGLALDYTVFATDGTDRQTIQGNVKVAINNNGGTETCVFSTPSEANNPSTGTLAVTWDCTAGTDTVMIRATADTSLASTTTFTMESRYNLTSGTATVTPQ